MKDTRVVWKAADDRTLERDEFGQGGLAGLRRYGNRQVAKAYAAAQEGDHRLWVTAAGFGETLLHIQSLVGEGPLPGSLTPLYHPDSRSTETAPEVMRETPDVMRTLAQHGEAGAMVETYLNSKRVKALIDDTGLIHDGNLRRDDPEGKMLIWGTKEGSALMARVTEVATPYTLDRMVSAVEELARGTVDAIEQCKAKGIPLFALEVKANSSASGQGNYFKPLEQILPLLDGKSYEEQVAILTTLYRHMGDSTKTVTETEMVDGKEVTKTKTLNITVFPDVEPFRHLAGQEFMEFRAEGMTWDRYQRDALSTGASLQQNVGELIAEPSVQFRITDTEIIIRSAGNQKVVKGVYQGWETPITGPFVDQMMADTLKLCQYLQAQGYRGDGGFDFIVAKNDPTRALFTESQGRDTGTTQYRIALQLVGDAKFDPKSATWSGEGARAAIGGDNHHLEDARWIPHRTVADMVWREGAMRVRGGGVVFQIPEQLEDVGKVSMTALGTDLNHARKVEANALDSVRAYTKGRELRDGEVLPFALLSQDQDPFFGRAGSISPKTSTHPVESGQLSGSKTALLRSAIPSSDGKHLATLANLHDRDALVVYPVDESAPPITYDTSALGLSHVCQLDLHGSDRVVAVDVFGSIAVFGEEEFPKGRLVPSTGENLKELGLPTSLKWFPNGEKFVVTYRKKEGEADQNTAYVVDATTGKKIKLSGSSFLHSSAVTAQGDRVFVGDDTHVRAYDPQTGDEIWSQAVGSPAVALAVHSDGERKLAAMTSGNKLLVMDVETGEVIQAEHLSRDVSFLGQPTFSPDGKKIVLRTDKGDTMLCDLSDPSKSKLSYLVHEGGDHVGRHQFVAAGPLTFLDDNTVRIVNMEGSWETFRIAAQVSSTEWR